MEWEWKLLLNYNYMEQELKDLITKLKNENDERGKLLNSGTLSDYNHTAKVHVYNNTLQIIKQIEGILKRK